MAEVEAAKAAAEDEDEAPPRAGVGLRADETCRVQRDGLPLSLCGLPVAFGPVF